MKTIKNLHIQLRRRKPFIINSHKWYLVDFHFITSPEIVRKHFLTREMAEYYRNEYFLEQKFRFGTFTGAELHKLKFQVGEAVIVTSGVHSKYKYPEHLKTEKEKKIWRIDYRAKQKKLLNRKAKTMEDTIQGRVHRFIFKSRSNWKDILVYSKKRSARDLGVNGGFKTLVKKYKYPNTVVMVQICIRTFRKSYGLKSAQAFTRGMEFWDKHHELMLKLYTRWEAKQLQRGKPTPYTEEEAKVELLARGFVSKDTFAMSQDKAYVIWANLVYPKAFEFAWATEADGKRIRVYDAQRKYGIPRFTGTILPKKYRK